MANKISKNKKQTKPVRKNKGLSGLQIAFIVVSAIIVLSMLLALLQS